MEGGELKASERQEEVGEKELKAKSMSLYFDPLRRLIKLPLLQIPYLMNGQAV